jgi:hypothetical protein
MVKCCAVKLLLAQRGSSVQQESVTCQEAPNRCVFFSYQLPLAAAGNFVKADDACLTSHKRAAAFMSEFQAAGH